MKKLLLPLMLILSIYGFAQPQFFNYQGVARDALGLPLTNTIISLKIHILETSVTGIPVYGETHIETTNDHGLFTLKIGLGSATTGTFSQIAWGSATHFLQVEMDPTGGSNFQMMGTSQLASVPYALYAETTGDTISSTSPWQTNPVGIDYKGGNVGIGTNNPEYAVDVQVDNALMRLQSSLNSQGSGIVMFPGNSVNQWWVTAQPGIAANPNPGGLNFLKRYDSGGGNIVSEHFMDITETGNVGIGTRTPTTKLQVTQGDVFIDGGDLGIGVENPDYTIDVQDDLATMRLKSTSAVHGSGLILLPGSSINQWWITSQPGIAGNPNPGGLNFLKRYDNGSGTIISEHIMDITDAGNVGIGTRTPANKLQITNGDVSVDGGRLGVGTTSPSTRVQISNGDVFLDNGKLGIGTSSPAYTIDVEVGLAAIRLESNSGIHGSGFILKPSNSPNEWWITSQPGISSNPNPGGLNFLKRYDNGSGTIISEHIMDITSTGNVGIGTRTPKTKLQVTDGDIYIEDISSGVIMRSPNGNCWRMTINNSGQAVVTSIICP